MYCWLIYTLPCYVAEYTGNKHFAKLLKSPSLGIWPAETTPHFIMKFQLDLAYLGKLITLHIWINDKKRLMVFSSSNLTLNKKLRMIIFMCTLLFHSYNDYIDLVLRIKRQHTCDCQPLNLDQVWLNPKYIQLYQCRV